MRATRLALLGAIAAVTLIAGVALGQGEIEVSDPDDDGEVRRVSYVGCGAPATCSEAPPGLEITKVEIRETPRDLVVRLEVEQLPEDMGEVAGENDPTDPDEMSPGNREGAYFVCWGRQGDDDPCVTNVYLFVSRVDGEIKTWTGSSILEAECADEIPCQYGLPTEIETGSPGAIEWRFPRTLLPNATEGAEVFRPIGVTSRLDPDRQPGVQAHFQGLGLELSQTRRYSFSWSYSVDVAYDDDTMTYELPMEHELPAELTSNHIEDPPRDIPKSNRSDLDVLDVAFQADQETLHVSVEKALVREDPKPQTVFVNFGFNETLPFIHLLQTVSDGERQFFANRWKNSTDGDPTDLTVEANVTPGEPGWVNFTVPLSEAPVQGRQLNWSWAGATDWTDRSETETVDGLTEQVDARMERFDWDIVGPGTAYTVGSIAGNETAGGPLPGVNASAVDNTTFEAEDDPGDASYPQSSSVLGEAGSTAGTESEPGPDNFEITGVSARATDADTVWLTIDIAALREVRVPSDWDAVLYAGSIQTPEGSFLAGLHKTSGGPNQQAEEVWLCSQDTAVLTDGSDAIPPRASWIQIDGVLDPSGTGQSDSGNQSGGGDSATIRVEVPRDCLDGSPPGPLSVEAVGAGTYLERNNDQQADEVHAVDEAQRSGQRILEPVQLSTASTGQPAPGPSEESTLAQPFGIENFWDMAGIAGTALASIVGAVLVRRRRNVLQEYLERIDEINRDYEGDPSGRQAAFRDLQGEAKDDLVDGALTENQYVVVKDRIADEIADARAQGVEEAFGELPHRLLGKLKTMVANGGFSQEDKRLFSTMLEDSALTDEAKDRIRRKLDVWAGEQAEA